MTDPCLVAPPVATDLIALAGRLADAAGAIVRSYYRTPVAVDDKADASPVTIADRQAETAMRAILREAVPDHGIIGEEHGSEGIDRDYVWVLDPIDGTKAFIAGMPTFGTLIALMHKGKPVLGVIDQAISGERWIGAQGHGTTMNGTPVRARACDTMGKAVLYSTDPSMFQGNDLAAYERLAKAAKLRRFGADCYAYGLMALGFVDVVCEADLQLYDYAAIIPVIEGAGGVITDWQGAAPGFGSDGRILAAGDRRTHAEALAILKG